MNSQQLHAEFIRRMGDMRVALIGKGVTEPEAATLRMIVWKFLLDDAAFLYGRGASDVPPSKDDTP